MILGAHVSIAGGVSHAPQNAADCTCETFQIFTKNQLQWKGTPLAREEIRAFRQGMRSAGLVPGTVHAAYLVNLAARDPQLLARSRACMVDDMKRTRQLGIPYLVVHPGSHRGQGAEKGLQLIARSLDSIFRHAPLRGPMILLESTTGAGSELGGTFEELAAIRAMSHFPARIGFCIDTCHIFGAGYDIRTAAGCRETLEHIGTVLGFANVRAFHLNDSKGDLGSHIDRHAAIGKGRIGLVPFGLLLQDPRFARLPGILETPGDNEEYAHNLAVLRSLRQ